MSEHEGQGSNASTPDPATVDRIVGVFAAYRQAGWALSVTVIGFSTALLAWSLPGTGASWRPLTLFYIQASAALVTIALAFLQQLFYYCGGKHLARSAFKQSKKSVSDRWFRRADGCALASVIALLATLVVSVSLWVVRDRRGGVAEITIYPLGRTSDGGPLPLNPTVYRLDLERHSIVYWWPDVDEAPRRLVNCAIRDMSNWRCDYPDGSGTFELQKGLPPLRAEDKAQGVVYVTREQWESARNR